jgi:hypothetical protein
MEGNMTPKFSFSSIAIKVSGPAAIAILMASLFGPVGTVQTAEVRHEEGEQLKPTGKGRGEVDPTGLTAAQAARFARSNSNGILYHGGPVMLGQPSVYFIWYGNWSGNTATTILTDFGNSLGGSPYFNINTTYYDGTGQHISGGFTLAGSTTDAYSQGTALSDAQVQQIVASALPFLNFGNADPNGVYFVLTSADVDETSGFCTQYCAWHTHGTIGGQDIKYAFIGNPDRCPSACAAQATSPNDNVGADGMANMIAHELSEAVTDPDLNAWFDRRGLENGDKCIWNFGTTYPAPNGSQYNVRLRTRQYLLQKIWANASGGYCTISYP